MLFAGDIPFINSSVKLFGVRISRIWNQFSRLPFKFLVIIADFKIQIIILTFDLYANRSESTHARVLGFKKKESNSVSEAQSFEALCHII